MIDDYGEFMVSLSRIGTDGSWPSATGPIHGVIAGADSKALVWTREPDFTELGYRPPADWESFMALADSIVDDGWTPFCLGLATPGANGWPATDWVEMVVLRTAGPDFYDSWIRHDVPFDDPVVVNAIRTVGEMVHRPGYLDISPTASSMRNYGDTLLVGFAQQTPACLMTPAPSFMPGVLDAGDNLAAETFAFPEFRKGFDDAIVGGGALAVPLHDRPEIRRFMAALASPDWGAGAAQLSWPLMLPTNARFDTATMANPEMAETVTGIQDAVRADSFRLDGSDSMPTDVASAFNEGMVTLFRDGSADNLDQLSLDVAHDIEVAWLELDEATPDQG